MLKAKMKNGKTICLDNQSKKETLLSLRQNEEFFCPVCEERVILKLGDKKIYHFSHVKGGNCRDFYENETQYHLEGKQKLYQWLQKQNVPVVLEYYDRQIQQRPDIVFQYNGKKYALEFQCSTISEETFKKRTNAYLNSGYIPLWILGSKNLNEKYRYWACLSNFHYLFMRSSPEGQIWFPSFSPESNSFHIIYSIFPYSKKNTFFQRLVKPVGQLTLSAFLEPLLVPRLNVNQWSKTLEQFKLNWSMYPVKQNRAFFTEVYNNQLNLFLFPSEIGLPLTYGLLIQTPPLIWQVYYFIDILQNKLPGDIITLQHLEASFHKRVKKKDIVLRCFPQIDKLNPLQAYLEYTHLLVRLGVLQQKTNQHFQVLKPLNIPKTNREKEEQTIAFFKENRKILERIK